MSRTRVWGCLKEYPLLIWQLSPRVRRNPSGIKPSGRASDRERIRMKEIDRLAHGRELKRGERGKVREGHREKREYGEKKGG